MRVSLHRFMKKFKNVIFTIILTTCILGTSLTCQAESTSVFTNDPRVMFMKNIIYVHVNDMKDWEPELVDTIMDITRSCTGYEIKELYLHRSSVSLSKSDAQMLQERTKYVQDWMAFHMPEIVRDGPSWVCSEDSGRCETVFPREASPARTDETDSVLSQGNYAGQETSKKFPRSYARCYAGSLYHAIPRGTTSRNQGADQPDRTTRNAGCRRM